MPLNSDLAENFFLMYTGNEFQKISETISENAKKFGVMVPTAKLYRKVVSTAADEELSNQGNRAVQQHMSHSAETAKRFYHFPHSEKSLKAYHEIEIMMKKQLFSSKEDEYILYEWPLTNEQTPSLALCKKILEKYQLTRTKKCAR